MLLDIRMHTKWFIQWHPKVIPSGVKQDLSHQSLHPCQVTTFTISHLGSTQESLELWSSALVHSGHSLFSIFLPYSIH
jgi:hypothetical protein